MCWLRLEGLYSSNPRGGREELIGGASIKPDDFEMKPLRGCKEHGWNICVVTDMFFDFRLFPFLVFANHCTHATNFPKSTVCLGW